MARRKRGEVDPESGKKPEGAYELDGVTSASPHNYIPADVVREVRNFKAKSNVHIIVDSCADFAPKVYDRLGVDLVCFPYVINGEEHLDDLWQSMSAHDFYEAMRKGARPTTSAVTPGRYYEIFSAAAQEGTPTLYLGFTRGLSSSIEAAQQAAEMVRAEHPGFELYVLDNLCPSLAAQLLAIEVVRQAGNGLTCRECYEWAKDARYFVQGYFTLESFDALAAGGRIPPAAANLGAKLDVKPELTYDVNGALALKGICRGRKKALKAIVQDFKDNYSYDTSLPVAICTSDAEKDGDWVEDAIRKLPGCESVVVVRSSVSPVIGSHTGPGMVAVSFWGSDRRAKTSLTDRIARRVRGQGGGEDAPQDAGTAMDGEAGRQA